MKKIAVPKVSDKSETRVPMIPDHAKRLCKAGAELSIEAGMGEAIQIADSEYEAVGVKVVKNRQTLISDAEIVLGLSIPQEKDIKAMKAGTVYAGLLDPFSQQKTVESLAAQGVNTICMEMVPRSTRAQKMDVLSSQASLAGYVAVLIAAERLDQIFPMMMTPAGTLKPSRVFVIGAGVAGLQAIATAKRLGARVEAFDTRPVVKDEVQSLGAKFIEIDLGETGQTKDGYAKALTEEQIKIQREGMAKICAHSDVVITTAQLFGRKAPIIVTEEMLKEMKPGSVIIDMAVESGGNVVGSKVNETVEKDGVKIVGLSNLPGRVATHASQMLSANLYNLLDEFWDKENKNFDLKVDDEIIEAALVTRDGKVTNQMLLDHYAK